MKSKAKIPHCYNFEWSIFSNTLHNTRKSFHFSKLFELQLRLFSSSLFLHLSKLFFSSRVCLFVCSNFYFLTFNVYSKLSSLSSLWWSCVGVFKNCCQSQFLFLSFSTPFLHPNYYVRLNILILVQLLISKRYLLFPFILPSSPHLSLSLSLSYHTMPFIFLYLSLFLFFHFWFCFVFCVILSNEKFFNKSAIESFLLKMNWYGMNRYFLQENSQMLIS